MQSRLTSDTDQYRHSALQRNRLTTVVYCFVGAVLQENIGGGNAPQTEAPSGERRRGRIVEPKSPSRWGMRRGVPSPVD